MKQTLIFVFLTIILSNIFGQTIEKQRFATGTFGATWQTRRDDLFTPLSYSGIGAELHIGSEVVSDQWRKSFDVWGGFNYIRSRVKDGYNSIGYSYRGSLSYTALKRLKSDETRFKWYLGGQFFVLGNGMYYPANVNNLFSFNIPVGLAAATYLSKDVHFLKKDWHVSTSLSLPLVAYNMRPNYLGFINTDLSDAKFGVSSLHNYWALDWRWSLEFPLSNSNRFRVTYRWEYLSDKLSGTLQQGSQGLLFETLLNIPYRQKNKNTKS